MNNLVRNILAFVAGIVAMMFVKWAVTMVGSMVVAPPAGADMSTMEGIKAAMAQFGPQHFVFPFLEHALGSLAGAAAAALFAGSHKMKLAIAIGVLHLLGGIAAAAILPAPVWFIVLDLTVAYLPMAWIGGKTAQR